MIGIYMILSPSQKIYIGQTINFHKRQKDYRNFKNIKSQVKLKHSFYKHGFENHQMFMIREVENKQELNFFEEFYIKLFDTFESEHGLNLTSGGKCKYVVSDETKMKLRLAGLGKKQSEETKEKKRQISLRNGNRPPKTVWDEEKRKRWSEITKGEKNGMYGKKMKPHVQEALLKANLGKRLTKEQKERMSERSKGVKKSESHRKAISAGNTGVKRTKYKIVCTKTGVVFNTLKDAAKHEGRSVITLKSMLKGIKENKTTLVISHD